MVVTGIIEQIIDKSNTPFKKRVAVVYDSINKNRWCVEFRKHLSEKIALLRAGDHVKITFHNDGRIDGHHNYYNNIVAKKIERL